MSKQRFPNFFRSYLRLRVVYELKKCYSFRAEIGIYRDNLSARVIGNNFLLIIVIAQNSLDLSITDIAVVIYFVIADKLSR